MFRPQQQQLLPIAELSSDHRPRLFRRVVCPPHSPHQSRVPPSEGGGATDAKIAVRGRKVRGSSNTHAERLCAEFDLS